MVVSIASSGCTSLPNTSRGGVRTPSMRSGMLAGVLERTVGPHSIADGSTFSKDRKLPAHK